MDGDSGLQSHWPRTYHVEMDPLDPAAIAHRCLFHSVVH